MSENVGLPAVRLIVVRFIVVCPCGLLNICYFAALIDLVLDGTSYGVDAIELIEYELEINFITSSSRSRVLRYCDPNIRPPYMFSFLISGYSAVTRPLDLLAVFSTPLAKALEPKRPEPIPV